VTTPFGLLPRIENGHSRLSAVITTEAQRAQNNNIYDTNVSEPSTGRRIKTPCLHSTRAGRFVKVDCAACSHTALLAPPSLHRLGLSPRCKVLDLKGRVRCRGCGA
jgi:hypothetical protein